MPRVLALTAAAAIVAVTGVSRQPTPGAPPVFVREVPWAGRGIWLRADLHAHTTFSDGSHTPEEVVAKAAEYGCDVAAITDHSDAGLKAATPEYFAAIRTARERHPGVTVLLGMEWNIPPGKGNDHVTMLLPGGFDDQPALAAFKERFDDFDKQGENPELADVALRWMHARHDAHGRTVFFLNHPSRKVAASADVVSWLKRWRVVSPSFLGFEGAPGHQHATPLGAYRGDAKPVERWDPVVAEPGGVWDQLLSGGTDLWGSSATSDFHSWENGDYWPCQFSETRVYARDRSVNALLDALRAGSFYGVHGGIVSDVRLTVSANGLTRPAEPGEVVRVSDDQTVTVKVELSATVPSRDWEGKTNRVDRLELIAVDAKGARVVETSVDAPVSRVSTTLSVARDWLVVRGRGCRVVPNGPGLCFYTNPIRVLSAE